MNRRTFLGFLAAVPFIGKALPVQPAVAVQAVAVSVPKAPVSVPVPPCAGITIQGRPYLVERIHQYSELSGAPVLDVTEKWISLDGPMTFEYVIKNGTIRECRAWRG